MTKKIKVFFKGSFYFTDNEICLIKALQDKGIDVRYYIPIEKGRLKAALFNIKKQYPRTGIFPARIYDEIKIYEDYFNLDSVFVINSVHKSVLHPQNLLLRLKVAINFFKFKPDIFHFTAPLSRTWMFLYKLKAKNVMTLHDPFPHSGQYSAVVEKLRLKAFKNSDRIIMLSDEYLNKFVSYYHFPEKRIKVSKLGIFDYLNSLEYIKPNIDNEYILFFGQIFPYKGIEFLLDAMVKVHEKHPNVKLVIAGAGKIYFDLAPYIDKDFIIIENKYIDMPQLIGLLKKCLFTVAPYTDSTQSGLLLNSFSLNVPVIATNVGVFPKMIKNNYNGYIVEPQNVDQLSAAINDFIENPDMLSHMRKNIDKWKEAMSWNIIADDFIKSYES